VVEEVERVVDGLPFDDAVQVEGDGLRAEQREPSQRDRAERGNARRLDRDTVERETREVAVVAGGDECATGSRGHQPAGGACRIECQGEHRRELLRDQRQPTGEGVDAVQLGGIMKTGEAVVAGVEERPHVVEGRTVRQHHVAAHRAEGVHEPLLWICGATVWGAGLITALPPKLVDESAVLAVAVLVLAATEVVVACVAGWASRTSTPNPANALTATAPIE
jgi:hypothetical protein